MRLSMRRIQPGAVFSSFLGILDIKLGCEIILLFGLINKVAGVYGLVTVFTEKRSFIGTLFYVYSIGTLFAFLWALKVVKSEASYKSMLVAHLYTLDHAIQTIFHYIFYYIYWYITAHDGKRELNSQAQKDIVELAASRGETAPLSEQDGANAELTAANARDIWNHEKGYALGVILIGFMMKVYFILVLYSYAAHLRSSTYHNLPLTTHAKVSKPANGSTNGGAINGSARVMHSVPEEDDDDRELAHAEAEVARINEESGRGNGKGKKEDQDEYSWD